MSTNWRDDNRFGDDPHARFSPEVLRRKWGIWAMVLLIAGGFICVAICAGVFLVFDPDIWAVGSADEALPAVELPLDDKRATVVAAYTADDIGVDGRQFKQIRRLFNAITQATASEDEAAFRQLIDFHRHFQQIKLCGVTSGLTLIDSISLEDYFKSNLALPGYWTRFKLAHVDLADSSREAIVYGFFWDANDECQEIRWWIILEGTHWKVFDWELLQYGMRDSIEWAYYIEYGESPGIAARNAMSRDIARADEFMLDAEYDHAAEQIRRAELRPVLPALRDIAWLSVAYAWSRCDRSEDFLRTCQQIEHPEKTPGADYGMALAHRDLGNEAEALVHLARYEEAVGPSPNVSSLRAEILEQLGRDDDAASAWLQLLRFDTDNPTAFRRMARLFPDDQKEKLVMAVERTSSPLATAGVLAASAAAYGDEATLAALTEFILRFAPDSPSVPFFSGLRHEMNESYDSAAESFFRAMESAADDELKQDYLSRYFGAMASDGRVVDAYRQAPDPTDAFRYLAELYDEGYEGFTNNELQDLVRAHREIAPDDPWGYYYAGILLRHKQDYEAAELEFQAGLAAQEESDAADSLNYERAVTLFRAGRGLDAYAQIEPRDETFLQLARLYEANEQFTGLQALLNAHRQHSPDDPWCGYYAAIVAASKQQFDEADRLLEQAAAELSEEYQKSQVHNQRVRLRITDDRPLAAYTELESPESTFNLLAWHFSERREWQMLTQLVDLHTVEHPDSTDVLHWSVEIHWQRKEYAQVAQLVEEWPADRWQDINAWRVDDLRIRRVRSCLRLHRISDAEKIARDYYEEKGDAFQQLLVLATQGASDEFLLLAADRYEEQGDVQDMYDDEDIGPILTQDAYREFRRKYPRPLPYSLANAHFVLLYEQPIPDDLQHIQEQLTESIGPGSTIVRNDRAVDERQSYLIELTDGHRVGLTFGDEHYEVDQTERGAADRNLATAQVVGQHTAWVSIEVVSEIAALSDRATDVAVAIAAAVGGPLPLAVYSETDGGMIVGQDDVTRFLRGELPGRTFDETGHELWLYRNDERPSHAERQTSREVRRSLIALTPTTGELLEGSELQILVAFRSGAYAERHWVMIDRIELENYGGRQYVGHLLDGVRLAPWFAAGDSIGVHAKRILNWRFTYAGETHIGRDQFSDDLLDDSQLDDSGL